MSADNVLRDKPGLLSPLIRRIEFGGKPAIVKDYRGRSLLARSIVGPSLVRREFRILRRLEGLPGVPRALAVLGGAALVVEYVEGRPFSKYQPGDMPGSVYQELCDIVRGMHARGVVHLDLRQKKNFLLTPDNHPCLLDFGGAVAPGPGSILRAFLPAMRRVDESALLKVKQRSFPHLLTDEDRAALKRHRFWRRFWVFTKRGKYVR